MQEMLMRIIAALALVLVAPPSATAEIVKSATIDCKTNSICLFWWPKLPAAPGWHTDQKANVTTGGNGIDSLVPDGSTFAKANAIIYASAVYRSGYEAENPKSKTLDAFIADDKASFLKEHKFMSITEVTPLTTADGQTLRSFTYFRPQDHTWERVSFGQEDDYYLVFTLSAFSEASYEKAMAAYEDVVHRYRK
jgi:hypothetical protein